jgi:protein TonB
MLLAFQMKPLPLQDTFQWNVSLVESTSQRSMEPSAQVARPSTSAPNPPIQPKHPVTTTPEVRVREAQAQLLNPVVAERQPHHLEAPTVMERHSVQTMTRSSLAQQQAVVVQNMAAVTDMSPVHEAEPLERSSQSLAQSVAEEKRAYPVNRGEGEALPQPDPAGTAGASITETREVMTAQPADASVIASSPPASVAPAIEAPRDIQRSQVAALPKESITPPASTELPQALTMAVQQAPAARADYGWLIESLGNRLTELKRYPAGARSNGLEGKVLLRAVIQADGNVTDISVQKSSGHEELDAAAMQTIRDASPLHLRHELGRAQIAITVPLVYKLATHR